MGGEAGHNAKALTPEQRLAEAEQRRQQSAAAGHEFALLVKRIKHWFDNHEEGRIVGGDEGNVLLLHRNDVGVLLLGISVMITRVAMARAGQEQKQ